MILFKNYSCDLTSNEEVDMTTTAVKPTKEDDTRGLASTMFGSVIPKSWEKPTLPSGNVPKARRRRITIAARRNEETPIFNNSQSFLTRV